MTKEDLLRDFRSVWENAKIKDHHVMDLEYFSEAVNKYAKMNRQFVNIYSMKQRKIVALSNNYPEVLGYDVPQDDYINNGASYHLRDLPMAQSSVYLQLSYLYLTKIKAYLNNSEDVKNIFMYFHNFRLKQKNGTKHLGVYATALNIEQTKDIDLILIINFDVSHMLKDENLWWFNLSVENKIVYSGHSDRLLIKPKHIFSNKEKELIQCLLGEKTSSEIAELLDISLSTVEKHRNNLIEWCGVKDTSQLLQIVKLGNLLA